MIRHVSYTVFLTSPGVPLSALRRQIRDLGEAGQGYKWLKLSQSQIVNNRNKIVEYMQASLKRLSPEKRLGQKEER